MATLVNSLYPPYMDTFMPAFVYDDEEGARISFSISPYNDTDSINYIHISLVDQATNKSVLKTGVLSGGTGVIADGILVLPFSPSTNTSNVYDEDTGLYYVTIPPTYLKGDGNKAATQYQLNRYYQAQIRFDNTSSLSFSSTAAISSHLLEHRQNFSEWSNVTLLRPIPRPIFRFNNLDDAGNTEPAKRLNEYNEER